MKAMLKDMGLSFQFLPFPQRLLMPLHLKDYEEEETDKDEEELATDRLLNLWIRFSKVERDVTIMKRLMALGEDYDMVTDDTPPNSSGDNPYPPPPPSTNLPSPPPPQSHPLLKTPPSPPYSPPQYDAAKKGENNQGIVIADILEIDATTDDHPIQDIGDQLETNDYEGFHDLGFMPQAVVPLNVVYLGSYFEREITQEGAHDVEASSS
ncbi:unnamed protein product [Lactuca saligna]|uniref:Uncharacterized protein n=1 Tax=Lactuca saligna TaxID=75948 RepID=A0AA35ZVH7_LACSI|nr:unnamed protein product [Lactuca saligna]